MLKNNNNKTKQKQTFRDVEEDAADVSEFKLEIKDAVAMGGTHITLVAVVGWFVLHTTLITDLLPTGHQLLSQDLVVLDGLHQAVSGGGR